MFPTVFIFLNFKFVFNCILLLDTRPCADCTNVFLISTRDGSSRLLDSPSPHPSLITIKRRPPLSRIVNVVLDSQLVNSCGSSLVANGVDKTYSLCHTPRTYITTNARRLKKRDSEIFTIVSKP